MCGVMGIFNNGEAAGLAAKGLRAIKDRGREAYGLAGKEELIIAKSIEEIIPVKSNCAIAHCLHSVVSFLPQPLKGKKGILAANCEIYNWKELAQEHKINCRNDAELLLLLIEKLGLEKALKLLDGVYAFAYWEGNKVSFARDVLGIKPIWYSLADSFAFASEKKALESIGFSGIFELNPRKIMQYDISSNRVHFQEREFFRLLPVLDKNEDQIISETNGLFANAVSKRIPDKEFGLLFSGGVDSAAIALVMKQLGLDFACYLAVIDEPGSKKAEDLEWSEKAAKELGLKLKIRRIKVSEVPAMLETVVPLIEDTNVTKVGVALTFYAACELAKKEGIKVIFSGLGSEEIFAGYERHLLSSDINKECYSGLLKIHERDTYRDDVITMHHNLELRLPFLDKSLVDYSLKIPAEMKIKDSQNKLIFRKAMMKMGMPEDIAMRKKRAAQYGSRLDNALLKLKRRSRLKTKSEYLRQFYPQKNLKLGALLSSGKDSMFAMHIMQKQNYEISCAITIKSGNPDSFMFHTPNVELARLQAESLGLPYIEIETQGKKEDELQDLANALLHAKEKFGIEGVITGALFSNYQRERIERIADSLGLKIFSPLWHMDQELEFRQIIDAGFKVIMVKAAAEGLDEKWLGREIKHEDIDKLVLLNKKLGLNIAGEGGEFETLVLDGPGFRKKIEIEQHSIKNLGHNSFALDILKTKLA